MSYKTDFFTNKAFSEFIAKLRYRLESELPGKWAQMLMTSSSRILDFDNIPTNYKKSSVLILLFPENDLIKTVFIQRPKYEGIHSGQISFPGGKYEKTDDDLLFTALRETHEEIGVNINENCIIGRLSELYIPPSNFMVYPFVGFLEEKPLFIADSNEVSEIIQANIFDFIDENNVILNGEIKLFLEKKLKIPYYNIDKHIIWGATAMIMSEFVQIIKSVIEIK